jgi:2-polyprenyl-6-methoxyphenol hydroxylase-like FAD-dependent oxidoreductase
VLEFIARTKLENTTNKPNSNTMGSTEQRVDIAIVGAGLAGLSTAVACLKVRPDARIKVYERRKAPEWLASSPSAAAAAADDEAVAVGGGVRLEMNGLNACAAISGDLAGRVVSEGLYARKVLLHDTQGACAFAAASHNAPDCTAQHVAQL